MNSKAFHRILPIACLVWIGCGRPEQGDTRIIGHGGLGANGEHPMDTREALLGGLALGLDGVELDVQLTADGVLVACHPEDLADISSCSGHVNAITWAALAACPNDKDGSGSYPIVRLDALLLEAVAKYPKAEFTFDCKLFAAEEWWPYLHAFTNALAALDSTPALHGRFLIECQVDDFLRLARTKLPDAEIYLYGSGKTEDLERALALSCTGVTVNYSQVDLEFVESARAAGLDVTLFGTTGKRGHRKALAMLPDRLQTDAPEEFAR